MSDKSRIPKFYQLSISDRVRAIAERGLLTEPDSEQLATGAHTLDASAADRMIENVVGVMGLPLGMGLNFLINGKAYVVPLAVEEPSIVAALSASAKLAAAHGGFKASATAPVLIGQVQVVDVADVDAALEALEARKEEILSLANSFHPKMVARGGGAVDLEFRVLPRPNAVDPMLVVHLLVDTRDAMGANLVNGMCEGIAPLVETITEGKVFLRILSNLTDRSLARAEVHIPVDALKGRRGFSGEQVRDGVVLAGEFAEIDPYRAATHNKGIMNGIDPVAIATGNDWRAIEAGAHAYAARDGRYSSLTQWRVAEDGGLFGRIELPLKVGTVGGPLQANPTVGLSLKLLGVESATELAQVMATVGLAQNFAALRALATEGIQRGHMTLHARSVVTAAGTPPELFDEVLDRVVSDGEIKIWKAKQVLADLQAASESGRQLAEARQAEMGTGFGKVVIAGEHAVVYGRHAIAAPVPLTIKALVDDSQEGVELVIPSWGVEYQLTRERDKRRSFERSAGVIFDRLGLADRAMRIEVFPEVPRGMGLGGSAAMAVAIVRALDKHFRLGLTEADINALAFESEKEAHGRPSGLDNTVASYGRPIVFRPGDPPLVETLQVGTDIPFLVALSGKEGLTAKTVGRVRTAWKQNRKLYERIFDEIDTLALQSVSAIADGDLNRLGELMNINHGLLNALQVSTPALEQMVDIARKAGALGAKLTGGGGGGSILVLADGNEEAIAADLKKAGYDAFSWVLQSNSHG